MDNTTETHCGGFKYSLIEEHGIVRVRDCHATVRLDIQLQNEEDTVRAKSNTEEKIKS